MTCIVGYADGKKVILGADSAMTGYDCTSIGEGKIWEKGEYLFGASGGMRTMQLLRYNLVLPTEQHQNEKDDIAFLVREFIPKLRECLTLGGTKEVKDLVERSDSYFLLGYHGRLYRVWFSFAVEACVHRYSSVGSGQYYALGSLYTTEAEGTEPQGRLRIALETAEEFEVHVRRPFTFIESNWGESGLPTEAPGNQ